MAGMNPTPSPMRIMLYMLLICMGMLVVTWVGEYQPEVVVTFLRRIL